MPTAGRLIRRLDGRLCHNDDGHLMRWPSDYPINVKVYFGEAGDEEVRLNYHSTYYSPADYPIVVASGDTLTLGPSWGPNSGYYLTSNSSAYKRATSTWVTVATGSRWEVHWRTYITAYNFDVVVLYWSTVGVWGPYQTNQTLFLTDMNYTLTYQSRTGVTIPSTMYLRP